MQRKIFFRYYMTGVGIFGQMAFFLQAYKTFKTESANDLSLGGVLISTFASVSWVAYGVSIKDRPLVLSNIVACFGTCMVITGILLYR
ncbi:MAG: hypothetical protein KA436_06335 [Oligoflexales bacterium]|nr:hypothetical protein [Oligoflexales bacterium]